MGHGLRLAWDLKLQPESFKISMCCLFSCRDEIYTFSMPCVSKRNLIAKLLKSKVLWISSQIHVILLKSKMLHLITEMTIDYAETAGHLIIFEAIAYATIAARQPGGSNNKRLDDQPECIQKANCMRQHNCKSADARLITLKLIRDSLEERNSPETNAARKEMPTGYCEMPTQETFLKAVSSMDKKNQRKMPVKARACQQYFFVFTASEVFCIMLLRKEAITQQYSRIFWRRFPASGEPWNGIRFR